MTQAIFVCSRCCRAAGLPRASQSGALRVPFRRQRRSITPLATPLSPPRRPFNTKPTASKTTLQQIFDHPTEWKLNRYSNSHTTSTGLFGLPAFDRPEGFVHAAQVAMVEIDLIVERVCAAVDHRDRNEMVKTVKRLDRLSEILCTVVDSAELIRNVHPDGRFVEAANEAHSALSSVINQLNTHPKLYKSLRTVMHDPTITKHFSEQELRVGNLLLADFEKSGVHMPKAMRDRYVDLQNRILDLGHEMITMAGPGVPEVVIENPLEKLHGVPGQVLSRILNESGTRATIPTNSVLASAVLRTARDEGVRKQVYLAMNSGSKEQVDVLEAMLWTRGELARLLKKDSYAELSLTDKMAETPEIVIAFLESLSDLHKPRADAEVDRLLSLKKMHNPKPTTQIEAWDRHYYSQFVQPTAARQEPSTDPFHPRPISQGSDQLAAYFSVGTVFEGLSNLFHALYCVTLVPQTVVPGEIWHDEVRKLDVIHDTDGKIGSIYCDLFARDSAEGRKYETAAHFTVRCSRRIDDEERFGEGYAKGAMRIKGAEKEVVEGGVKKRYQLPIVVLVTAFSSPRPDAGVPALLSLWEVETLFHEMGHAMHSMLARTDFQHISGTRVPMDFVEVPSIFTETFAKNPQVLSLIGRHHQTNTPIPPSLLPSPRSCQPDALEIQNQLQLSLLDQMYHSPLALDAHFSSTAVLTHAQQLYGAFPPPQPPAAWQVQFTHLVSYGATYYSYFWSRRWAGRIFRRWFGGDVEAWGEGGEMFRKEVLHWGGGRDPWVGLERMGVVREGEREGKFRAEMADLGVGEGGER